MKSGSSEETVTLWVCALFTLISSLFTTNEEEYSIDRVYGHRQDEHWQNACFQAWLCLCGLGSQD